MAQFWNQTAAEPKRQFRFKVVFKGIGADVDFLVQSADRPTFTVSDTTKVDFLDKSFHFPGKVTWNPVKIKYVDVTGASGGETGKGAVAAGLTNSGWLDPSQITAGSAAQGGTYKTINKASAVGAASASGKVQILVLDSNGTAADTWTLNNAFISSVTFNNLDYAAEGILTTELTVRYDWASI